MNVYQWISMVIAVSSLSCYASASNMPSGGTPAIRNGTSCQRDDLDDPPRTACLDPGASDARHKSVLFVINHYSSHLFESAKLGKVPAPIYI